MKSLNRNDPCLCGSGLKYKKCCLEKGISSVAPPKPDIEKEITAILNCASNGNLLEATRACKVLLDAYPSNSRVLYITARIMFQNGMRDSCLMLLQKAISLEPDNASYHALMSDVFLHEQQLPRSLDAITRAIELAPNEPIYLHRSAVLHLNMFSGQANDEAIGSLRRITTEHPHFFPAYHTLYTILDESRLDEEAAALYQKLLALNPPMDILASMLGKSAKNYCTREEISRDRQQLEENIERIAASNVTLSPFTIERNVIFPLAYHASNNRPILEKLSAMYRKIYPYINIEDPHSASRIPGTVLKIGFISSFFYEHHIVMILLQNFIRSFATDSRYKTIIFDVGNKGAELPLVKEKLVTHVPLPNNISPDTYHLIGEQACDVLVYLDIGMSTVTYLMAFARLAPLQLCLNGHPITSGISTIDYYVSSKVWEPPQAQDYYSEKLIALDSMLSCRDKPTLPTGTYSRHDLGFPERGNLYACPVSTFKIHPDFYEVVVKILQKDPQGKAVFFKYKGVGHEVILRHFQKIAPEESTRILFVPWVDANKFIPAMKLCDVVIDTFHFGSFMTLFDIFAAGTPVVTWTGEFSHGRVGTAFYKRMGISELIAGTWDEYAEIAVRLGTDVAYNQAMRKKILANNHHIYGETGAASEFKQVLETLISRN